MLFVGLSCVIEQSDSRNRAALRHPSIVLAKTPRPVSSLLIAAVRWRGPAPKGLEVRLS